MKERELNIEANSAIKKLELVLKKLVRTRKEGFFLSLFKGKGLEFESYRDYSEEDDASLIDWKASMRTNNLVVKKFKEERDLKIMFIMDISNKMLFGSTEKLKCEYAGEVAAALSYIVLENGDRIGFCFISDAVKEMVPPKSGVVNFYDFLIRLKDPGVYGGKFNLKKVLKWLTLTLKRDYIVILLSDFLGPINWSRELRVLSSKLEILGIKVEDPRDFTIPKGTKEVIISDPNSEKTRLVDMQLVKEQYERYAIKHREAVKRVFKNSRSDLLILRTDQEFIAPLIRFLKKRTKWR